MVNFITSTDTNINTITVINITNTDNNSYYIFSLRG